MSEKKPKHDPILEPYLLSKDDAAARGLLDEAIATHALPIIRGIVAQQLDTPIGRRAAAARRQESEELHDKVAVQLVARLREVRRGAPPAPGLLEDLRGHAALVATQTCQAWVRRLFPQRTRLRNRLRYLLRHDDRFVLQAGAGDAWSCELAQARSEEAGAGSPRDGAPESDSAELMPRDLADVAFHQLTRAAGPLDLDLLVDAVAERCGLVETVARFGGGAEPERGPEGQPAAAEAGQADDAATPERRDYLRQLWDEILLLPRLQRAALLLNMRDSEGRGVIGLLPVTGVAGIRRMATVAGLPPEQFAGLWRDLPLEDATIAARLGVTHQQVASARKAARQRLARRMRAAVPKENLSEDVRTPVQRPDEPLCPARAAAGRAPSG